MTTQHDPKAAQWRRSSYSGASNGSCVEVADHTPDAVPVRDSKNPHTTLTIPADAWQAFVARLKA